MKQPTAQDMLGKVEAIITPTLESRGYSLVQVRILDGKGKRTLQVMAEPFKARIMTVDDCADISWALSAVLDVEDPIQGAYDLEISSPGIDRPLTKPKDFDRFAGHEIKLETTLPMEGRRRFKGKLNGINEQEQIQLQLDEKTEVLIDYANIHSASLVLTDDLIKEYLQAHKKQQKR